MVRDGVESQPDLLVDAVLGEVTLGLLLCTVVVIVVVGSSLLSFLFDDDLNGFRLLAFGDGGVNGCARSVGGG